MLRLDLNRGFSLIELLVVVTLMGIIGMITTQMFILNVKSQSKSELGKEVKQNGDYALAVIESMLRAAVDIVGSTTCNQPSAKTLTILNPDGLNTTFDCSSSQMASISSGFPDGSPDVSLPLTSSKVIVSNCNLRLVCPTPPINPKYVFVSFKLSQSIGGQTTPLPDSYSSIDFQSTVSLRGFE